MCVCQNSLVRCAVRFIGFKRCRLLYKMRASWKRKRSRTSREDDDGNVESEDEDESSMVRRVNHKVFFHAPVTKKTVLKLIECIQAATEQAVKNDNPEVVLYIHSEGGDAYAGLSAHDHLRTNRVPILTIVDGFVASAGTFLLLAGKRRVCKKNACVLIHQLSYGVWAKYQDMMDEVKNATTLFNTIKSMYAENTTIGRKRLEGLIMKEINLTSAQCLKWGVVDEVE